MPPSAIYRHDIQAPPEPTVYHPTESPSVSHTPMGMAYSNTYCCNMSFSVLHGAQKTVVLSTKLQAKHRYVEAIRVYR